MYSFAAIYEYTTSVCFLSEFKYEMLFTQVLIFITRPGMQIIYYMSNDIHTLVNISILCQIKFLWLALDITKVIGL